MEAMKSTQVLKVVNSVRLDNHDHMVSKDYDEKLRHLKYNLNFILVKNAREPWYEARCAGAWVVFNPVPYIM